MSTKYLRVINHSSTPLNFTYKGQAISLSSYSSWEQIISSFTQQDITYNNNVINTCGKLDTSVNIYVLYDGSDIIMSNFYNPISSVDISNNGNNVVLFESNNTYVIPPSTRKNILTPNNFTISVIQDGKVAMTYSNKDSLIASDYTITIDDRDNIVVNFINKEGKNNCVNSLTNTANIVYNDNSNYGFLNLTSQQFDNIITTPLVSTTPPPKNSSFHLYVSTILLIFLLVLLVLLFSRK